MAKIISMFYLTAVLMIGVLFQSSVAQTTHTVGDSTGWAIPSGGAATYSTWASQQTFVVGDVLVFNFATGSHDVTEVTKASFNSCTTSNPISTTTTAPVSITLSSAGERYFICSFSGHCNGGQKLAVNVSSSSTATPPTGTTASPPPPPPSSASSLSSMILPVALFSIILSFFY